MCSERRGDVEAGILLYLKDLAVQLVPANHANKRGWLSSSALVSWYIVHFRPLSVKSLI